MVCDSELVKVYEMNDARFRKLRARVKTYLDFTDYEVLKWWVTPIEAFGGKTPSEMSSNSETFKQMEDIIDYSELDISGGLRRKNRAQDVDPTHHDSSVVEENP